MPEGFTPAPEDLEEIRRRKAERTERQAGFNDQRNAILETDSPDDAAYDLKKSRELGIPREAIGGAREDYRAEDTLRKMQEMRQKTPRTAEWLSAPENYAVAKDEAEGLTAMERAVLTYLDVTQTGKFQQALASFFPAAEASMAGIALDAIEAPGLTPFDKAITTNLDKIKTPDITIPDIKTPPIRNPFAKAKVRVPEALDPKRIRDRASANAIEAGLAANKRLEAARPRGVTPESQAILSGVGSGVEMAPAMAAGLISRNPTLPMSIMGRQVYGQSYLRGREEGLSPGGAALYAGAHSGVERVTERLGLEILFGKGFVGRDIGKRFFASLGVEQVQEQFATLGQDFVDWQVLNPSKTFDQFLDERGEAAYQTAIATLVASAPTNATVLGIEQVVTEMTRDAAAMAPTPGETAIADLLAKVRGSKLSERSPEKMAEFVEALTKDGQLETVVVDLDGVVEALNQAGVDPTETLTALGVTEEELAQKWERFGEVEVKTSTLATSPAMKTLGEQIGAHIKIVGDPATPAQKETLRAEFETALKDGAAQIQNAIETGRTTAEKVAQVREAVKARILGAGMDTAGPQLEAKVDAMTAMLTTLPQRIGQDVLDFYAARAPKVQGQMEGETMQEGEVLEQARTAGYEGTDRGEAASWLRGVEKFGPEGMTTEARMARAKEMGFDTDEVFYHGTGDLTNFSGGFDPNMTGLGNDQLGSGFYFTNQAETASGYTTRRLPTGENKLGGEDAPGVLPVVLSIQNPIVLENGTDMLSQKVEITAEQAEAIIRQSPLLAEDVDNNPLGNWHDIWSEGVQDWMIGDVASSYEGNTILSIENDFFKGHAEAFRRAVRDVLGYDGVIQKFDSGEVHKVAWFPEQVRSVHAAFDPDQPGSADLLAQLIGPKAKSANKEILNAAKKMAKEKVKNAKGKKVAKYTRQQIWDETAKMGQPWYQNENGEWISEIEDGTIVVREGKGKLDEVIEFPSIYAEYPDLKKTRADARKRTADDIDGAHGVFTPRPFMFGVHIRITARGEKRQYTATHEIQHAVDDLEGRKMGGRKQAYAKKPTERRAFNTMYRRLWTMEERIATPPWETEQEAVDWWIAGRMNDARPAEFVKQGTFDPVPGPVDPEATARMAERPEGAIPNAEIEGGFVQGEMEAFETFDEKRQRTITKFRGLEEWDNFDRLLGRTFLSTRSIVMAMQNNPRLREVILGEAAAPLTTEEKAAFDKQVRAEIKELTALAARLRAAVQDEVSWKVLFGVRGEVDTGQVYNLLAEIDTPVLTNGVGRLVIAQIISSHASTRTADWKGEPTSTENVGLEVDKSLRKALKGSQAMRNAVQAFRSMGVQPDKAPKRPARIPQAEVKKVEAALAGKLLDLDAPMSEQTPEHYAAIRALWDAETERLGMDRDENGELVPAYVDFWESDYWNRDIRYEDGQRTETPTLPLDQRSAREVLELLAQRSMNEDGGAWMEGVITGLRAAGIVGAKYVPGGVKQDGAPSSQSIVIFDERAPVLLTDQSGNLMQERRGQYAPRTNIITLFEQADVTTLMHEAAHWYLETLYQMTTEAEVHPFVKDQYDAILKWGKVGKDFRMYDDAGRLTPEAVELQESFAETFEAYLQTGKAPSAGLREAFRAFKAWITQLWKRMYGGGQPERANLNPEIVAVMDRMLAVDEEIDAQVEGIIQSAEQQADELVKRGIITKRQRDQAIMNLEGARASAKEDLMARLMEAKMREDEAWWTTERARVRRDVLREFDRSPVGRALSWLGYGRWKGDVPVEEAPGDAADVEMYQSIRTAARMPMQEVGMWVAGKVDTNIQDFQNGDESAVMNWDLTEDPDSPRVMMSIRLNRATGRADVNLFLNNQMADALEQVEDVAERSRLAMEMFSQAVMVMRQYASETPDLKSFNFIAAESQAKGTKRKSREDLYRFMLSTLKVDGYTAFEIMSQSSIVREEDGAKVARPWIPAAGDSVTSGFMLVRDGVDPDEIVRSEIFRGNQSRGNPDGEAVSATVVKPIGPETRAARGGMDRRGSRAGAADTGSTLGQSLPRDLIRPASEKQIGAAPPIPDKAALTEAIGMQISFAETVMSDTPDAGLADVTMRLRKLVEQSDRMPNNAFLGAWYGNLEALVRVLEQVNPAAAPYVRTVLEGQLAQDVKAVLDDRGIRILQPEQVGEAPLLLIRERMFEGDVLAQSIAPTFYSALARFVSRSGTARAPAAQWKGMISNAPGIKAEEVEWTGVMQWLDLQDGPVTREALAAFVEGNGVRVEEVVRGGGASVSDDAQRQMLPLIERRDELQRELESEYYTGVGPDSMEDAERNAMFALEREVDDLTSQIDNLQRTIDLGLDDAMNDTKWSSWTLPGGSNYREMLLTLPTDMQDIDRRATEIFAGRSYDQLSASERAEIDRLNDRAAGMSQTFNSSHWDERNVLAHVRFKERTGPNGERVLALEEIQSDWHQAGRERGYNDAESKARRQQEVDDAKQRGDDAANSAREASERNKGLWDQLRVGGMATQQDMPDANPVEIARENQRRFRQGLINLGMQPSTYVWLGADDVQNVMREFSDRIDKVARSDSITLEMMFPGLSDYSLLQAIVAAQRDFMSAVASREAAYARMRSLESIQGVPNAPFKNNAWTELVLKRMIRYAAENGFDAVAWIPGNVQNGRIVDADDNRGDFYDKIVPNIANKLGKKFGARVTQTPMEMPAQARGTGWEDTGQPRAQIDAGAMSWWTLPLTPELAAAAMTEGFPLFQPGDPKGWGETAPPPDLPPMRLDLKAAEELYGKAAVDALPRAIKDRYRDQTSVDGMFAAARAAAKTLKRKPPKSLLQFIRARKSRAVEGKTAPQKQWGIKGAADELKAMDRPDLINEESGIHIDYMRELAEEAGYLGEGSTPRDLLDAIDKEARGEPVYSERDREAVQDHENAQQWADWLDGNGVDIFERDEKKLKAAIAKVMRETAADLVTPDQAAEQLGFGTGEELLKALAVAGSRERFIEAETDRRMREEFGDPFTTGEFAEAARQSAESEIKLMAAEIEIEALSRALGETAASKLAKEMAMDALSLMTVKELAGWTRFLDIERREMRNAMRAVQQGDIAKALTHKRRQLVNGHLAKAAREKSEAIEKTRKDLLTYLTSKGRRAKIARDYLDKIEALLETYELRVSKQGPGLQRKALSAKEYVDQMTADGREAEIAPEAMLLAAQADKKVWRGLTVDEVDYLAGTVRNLAHLGRTKNSLLKAQDKRRFDAVVGELVDALVAAGPLKGSQREYSFRKTTGEKITSGLRTSHAWLMRMEHQFRALDGKANGPIWNALFRIFADAADVESKMMAETAREVREAYELYTPLERYRMHNVSVALPELPSKVGKRWTKMEVISMALNWGVEYNRQALLEGYGWEAAQVEAVFARLMTDKDWDFVERVWEVSGKYKAEAFALEKQMTGVEPKSVEGIEFTTASGRKIKGRYFHLEYDARQLGQRSRRQAQQDAKEALSDRMKSFTKPMTKNGGLINRVGSGGKPVKLHISVFDKAVADTIHDIAYRRAVIDASRIINDPRFADAYEVASGKEAYEQLMPWIEAIVKPPSDQATGGLAALVAVRRNLPVAYMGYKVGTALIQATGLLAGVPEVGLRWVAQGFAKATVGSPLSLISAYQAVAEKSAFMADRPKGYDRDVREVTTAMGASTPLGAIKRNAFILISGMDLLVSVPIWIGAYDKAMAGKVKGIDAANEEDAIAYADGVIRRTQTSGRPQDLARVSRDSELWKQVTMLFGYFSNLYGYTSQKVRAVRTGETTPPQFLFYMTIMFVAIPILTELLAGRLLPGDDEDDDETIEEKMGKAVVSNFAGMFPVVRDVVNYQLEPQYGYKLSPVASGMQDVAMTVNAPLDGEMTEGEYRRAVRAMGAIFGLPSSQIVITGDYLADLLSGSEAPLEDPADAAREALVRDTR